MYEENIHIRLFYLYVLLSMVLIELMILLCYIGHYIAGKQQGNRRDLIIKEVNLIRCLVKKSIFCVVSLMHNLLHLAIKMGLCLQDMCTLCTT